MASPASWTSVGGLPSWPRRLAPRLRREKLVNLDLLQFTPAIPQTLRVAKKVMISVVHGEGRASRNVVVVRAANFGRGSSGCGYGGRVLYGTVPGGFADFKG